MDGGRGVEHLFRVQHGVRQRESAAPLPAVRDAVLRGVFAVQVADSPGGGGLPARLGLGDEQFRPARAAPRVPRVRGGPGAAAGGAAQDDGARGAAGGGGPGGDRAVPERADPVRDGLGDRQGDEHAVQLLRGQRDRGKRLGPARTHRGRLGPRLRDDDAGRLLLLGPHGLGPRHRPDPRRRLERAVRGLHGRSRLGPPDRRGGHRHAHRPQLPGRRRRIRLDRPAHPRHRALPRARPHGPLGRDEHDRRRQRRLRGLLLRPLQGILRRHRPPRLHDPRPTRLQRALLRQALRRLPGPLRRRRPPRRRRRPLQGPRRGRPRPQADPNPPPHARPRRRQN
mmetsp:Transcript_21719/g.68035  ORF Transcript_21719/g.68035 Transcript_21719/m.68035 type:complete len:339 (+) Transcript_21719:120-1136(+)